MWFPRFLFVLLGLIVYKSRTPNLAEVHYDVYRHVMPHLYPHIYPSFPMYVFVCNHRVSHHKMVSLSQLSLILLSGDMAVRFGFANCRSIRNKGPLLADEVKSGGFDVFGLTETHMTHHFLSPTGWAGDYKMHSVRVCVCTSVHHTGCFSLAFSMFFMTLLLMSFHLMLLFHT